MRIPNFNINRKKKKKVWMLKIAIHSNIIDIKIYWIQNKKNERASKFLRYKFVRWSKNIEPSLFEASHWTTGHGPLHVFFKDTNYVSATAETRNVSCIFLRSPLPRITIFDSSFYHAYNGEQSNSAGSYEGNNNSLGEMLAKFAFPYLWKRGYDAKLMLDPWVTYLQSEKKVFQRKTLLRAI